MTDVLPRIKLNAGFTQLAILARVPFDSKKTEQPSTISMWIILSLSASVLWGLTYVIDEQIYERISVFSSLSIASFFAFLVMLVLAFIFGDIRADLRVLSSSKNTLLLVAVGTFTFIAAESLIGLSIQNKNATLAGFIEVSYPIFIPLFTTLFVGEIEINLSTFIGGLLILVGVFLVSYSNR